jgi:hypothetical protein
MQVEGTGIIVVSSDLNVRKLEQPPKEWIAKAKEILSNYLLQTDLTREITPEWIGIHSFKKGTFKDEDLGLGGGLIPPVVGYKSPVYPGFEITFQVGDKTYKANTAARGRVEIHFPVFEDYTVSVTRDLILKIIGGIGHQLNQEIDPKTVKVKKTRGTLDRLHAAFGYTDQLEITKDYDKMATTYDVDLRIGDYSYAMVVLKNGKLAINESCAKLGQSKPVNFDFNPNQASPAKKMAYTGEYWVDGPKLNDGKPFELCRCPHKIVAKATELIGEQNLKLDFEEEKMLSFKQLGIRVQGLTPRIPGWHLRFLSDKSAHDVYIDAEGKNALYLV